MQRQVRQYLSEHHETIPGNKGATESPTGTVVFESFATLTRVELRIGGATVDHFHGWQGYHERVFQALGLAPLIVKEIFQTIVRLREDGITVLLVEQNARAALKVADRGYAGGVISGPSRTFKKNVDNNRLLE